MLLGDDALHARYIGWRDGIGRTSWLSLGLGHTSSFLNVEVRLMDGS